MSHGLNPVSLQPENTGALAWVGRVIDAINRWVMRLGMLALLAAALILTYSVFSRYFFKASSDWQDEAAIFCLVGATFLCGAYVQSCRGHIGIEALAGVLPLGQSRPLVAHRYLFRHVLYFFRLEILDALA